MHVNHGQPAPTCIGSPAPFKWEHKENKALPSSPAAEFPTASLSWSTWLETALPLFVLRRTLNALFIFLKDLLLIVERSKCRAARAAKKSICFNSSRSTSFLHPSADKGQKSNALLLWIQHPPAWRYNYPTSVPHPGTATSPVYSANHMQTSVPASVAVWERIILGQGRISNNPEKNV